MRDNPIYYIDPSSIAITPNANNSTSDLAVYIARDTKIKVYEPRIFDLGYEYGTYREWSITGRNRRLAEDGAYNIYARLSKTDKTAYLVFSKNDYALTPNITRSVQTNVRGADGKLYNWPALSEEQVEKSDYWWVRLGMVSAVEDGVRTVVIDTGILGTDQYNTEWLQNPDSLPYRMEVLLTYSGGTADVLTDPVAWGRSVEVECRLTQGWDTAVEVDHWGISRETEYGENDDAWNTTAEKRTVMVNGVERTYAQCGRIVLHFDSTRNDFGELGTATFFTFTAYNAAGTILRQKAVNIPHEDLGAWQVDLDTQSFAIMVDDCGNVRGGLWTEEEGEDGQTYRTYRLHTAVTVLRKNKYLTLAPAGTDPGIGQYQIYPQSGECTLMVSNGVVYVTAIEHTKDGVSGSEDDVQADEWYDAMRRMKEAMMTFTVVCEGVHSEIKSVPIAIGHIDTSIVDVQLMPAALTVQRDSLTGALKGLPVRSEVILGRVEGSVQPVIESSKLDIDGVQVEWSEGIENGQKYSTATGWDVRYIVPEEGNPVLELYGVPTTYAGTAVSLGLTVQVKYSGIRYEYRKVFSVGFANDVEPSITYHIETSQDNITIMSDTTSATANITASFFKKIGQQAETAYSCHYAFYRRVENTYTRLANSGTTKYESKTLAVTVSSDSGNLNYAEAIVIFISDEPLTLAGTQYAPPQAYLAKHEIAVLKNGNTGPQGGDAVTYRCQWTLGDEEVSILAASYTGALKGSLPLVATLMKRVGSGNEVAVTASGTTIKVQFYGLQIAHRSDVQNPQFTISSSVNSSLIDYLNSNAVKELGISFEINDGDTYTSRIPKIMDGTSITGATGPIPIPYEKYNVNTVYTRSADMAPYVWQVVGGARKYYILVSSTAWVGNQQDESINTPAKDVLENGTTASWQEIPNFPYLQTEVLMADMGTIGSWVFWGNYMFSAQGEGDLGKPEDAGGSFRPNLIFDAATGSIKAAAGNCILNGDGTVDILGTIRAKMSYTTSENINGETINFEDKPANTYIISGNVKLPDPTNYKGLQINVVFRARSALLFGELSSDGICAAAYNINAKDPMSVSSDSFMTRLPKIGTTESGCTVTLLATPIWSADGTKVEWVITSQRGILDVYSTQYATESSAKLFPDGGYLV